MGTITAGLESAGNSSFVIDCIVPNMLPKFAWDAHLMSDSLYVPDMVLLHHAQPPDTRQFLEKADEEEKTNTLFSTVRYIYVKLLNAPYSNLAEPREFPKLGDLLM